MRKDERQRGIEKKKKVENGPRHSPGGWEEKPGKRIPIRDSLYFRSNKAVGTGGHDSER